MVAASVNKTGAVSFSKAVPDCPPNFRDSNLSCQFAAPTDHAFFQRGLSLSDNRASVQCYSISAENNAAATPVVDCAFILPSSSVVYVEAARPVTSFNKDSLASVLEFADEAGCSCVYACVKKDNIYFTEILRSYNEAGFASVTPFQNDMVKLQFQI